MLVIKHDHSLIAPQTIYLLPHLLVPTFYHPYQGRFVLLYQNCLIVQTFQSQVLVCHFGLLSKYHSSNRLPSRYCDNYKAHDKSDENVSLHKQFDLTAH